jgi:hypothetical protein
MSPIGVKWFLSEESSANLEPSDFVPLFHEWIRTDRLPDDTLIDVADYSHVRGGPGVVLVAHRSAYGIDSADGGLGLSYRLARAERGSNASGLELAFFRSLRACRALEEEPRERLRFRTDLVRLRFLDRLRAESAETAAPFLERIFAGGGSLEIRESPPPREGEPAGLVIETATPLPIATLLARLSGEAQGGSAPDGVGQPPR